MIGRRCALAGIAEVSALKSGMDFRRPEYRREVFQRFYTFHLRYRSHPGAVYYLLPGLAEMEGWDMEARLWFAFLNGNTQNPVTSWIIFRQFPDVHARGLADWFRREYARLAFDTDRRYHKAKFVEAVERYQALLAGRKQEALFAAHLPFQVALDNFGPLWELVRQRFAYFGRLSAFSYLEYLRVMGLPVACDRLFLEDRQGSRSHRNGLCKVLGRDDLDWHESNPGFDGVYGPEVLAWLESEAADLLKEARARAYGAPWAGDVGYFTLESTLCTYKGWHRPNRRYPNVYNDMLVDRIRAAEAAWGDEIAQHPFWKLRRIHLPAHLRLEDNPADCGCQPKKQNHYLNTGEVIMMHREWRCFRNRFNDEVEREQRAPI